MTNNHFTQPFGMVKGLIDFACLAMVTILSALFNQAGARTITAPDKVVYEITSETAHTARVSIENQSIHRENASPVTILSEVTDPDNGQTYTVTEIVENAFRATAITAIDIQAGITSIPSNTFRDCPNLETVVFPQTLNSIGTRAFSGCAKLTTPIFPEGLLTIENSAFYGAFLGADLVLPKNITLGASAFYKTTLPSIVFPEEGNVVISSSTFQNVQQLRELVIPSYLENIPTKAFYQCSDLELVDFSKVTSGNLDVGQSAFDYCKSLKTVIFPDRINQIRREAFYRSGLTSLKLPQMKSLGLSAFKSTKIQAITQDSWPETPIENIASSVFMQSSIKEIAFPLWMTEIPDGICQSCATLSKVSLHENIVSIGNVAFYATMVEDIQFPSALKVINASAFAKCNLITELDFPAGLESLGKNAFANCENLTRIHFDFGLKAIGAYAFQSCKKLSNVTLPESLINIQSYAFDGCNALSSITLPESLETIEERAFSTAWLTEITIPSSTYAIGNSAFSNCRLTTINLPEPNNPDFTPITFGSAVFEGNPITSFVCPEWLTIIPASFLQSCKLQNVSFATNVVEIKSNAFQGNYLLQVGSLPATITQYGYNAFKDCGCNLPAEEYFATVYVGNNVNIGNNAFENAKINTVEFTDCDYNLGSDVFKDVTTIERISFSDCMTKIPDGICNGWTNLKEVKWPAQLESIGDNAFYGCINLNFGLDENGEGNVIDFSKSPFDNIEYVGTAAFWGTNITKVIWPETVENFYLGNSAFKHTQITEIDWPTSIVNFTIEDGVFSSIATLTTAHIPGWMESIPRSLFSNCTNLTDLIWENSDREHLIIQDMAFSNTGIETISWPNVPTTIRANAFAQNSNATKIIWPEQPATLADGTFYGCTSLIEPTSVPSYITSIPARCFANCSSLSEFTLHNGITSVEDNAFKGCSSMTKFLSYADIDVIATGCFMDCTALKYYYAANPITEFELEAFCNCPALEELNLTNGDVKLEKLWPAAFYGCSSLTEFPDIISNSTELSQFAFAECKSLRHISTPTEYSYNSSPDYRASYEFYNAQSLQSVNFLLTPDERLAFNTMETFYKAPLLGVSYAPFNLNSSKINDCKNFYSRDSKGILMVNRDQKYKLMEKGYGDIWDIREIKSPQLKLYGDIHSEFTPGGLRNHYKTMIRWEIVESDLREDAPTVYHLCRDGKEIARIEVSTLKVLDSVNDGNVNRNEPTNSYAVKITRDGVEMDMSEQYGDFDYEFEPGGYIMVYSNQQKNLYFNPETSHRIGLNEKMGINSWFLFVDEFDSPDLNEPGVPDRYTYTLAMDGYPYREPVNNEGYLPGDDGLYWHYEDRVLDRVESEPCVVHTAMAVPSIDIYGLYSLADIQADTDGTLPVSKDVMSDGVDVRLSYEFSDPEQVGHYLFEHPIHYPIIQNITCFELPSRNNPEVYSELQSRDINGNTSLASGNIPVPADHNPTIGASYQIVTNTLCRGTFGSRIVTIPGVPDLNADMDNLKLCFATPEHNHEPVFRANIHLYPDVDMMGYYELPDDSQHSIGVWRGIGRQFNAIDMMADGATGEEELIYHLGDDRSFHSWSCTDCREHQKYDTADGQWSYTDHFATGNIPVGQLLDIKADYRVRLYVQTVDDPSKWMIAEAHTSRSELISGVEDVIADPSGTPVYYNLQGIKVESPRPGEVLIRVDRSGSQKVIFE